VKINQNQVGWRIVMAGFRTKVSDSSYPAVKHGRLCCQLADHLRFFKLNGYANDLVR
jgi:hypothetical protein